MFEPKEEKVVLYAYVTEANLAWIEKTRRKLKKSKSQFVDDLLAEWKSLHKKQTIRARNRK